MSASQTSSASSSTIFTAASDLPSTYHAVPSSKIETETLNPFQRDHMDLEDDGTTTAPEIIFKSANCGEIVDEESKQLNNLTLRSSGAAQDHNESSDYTEEINEAEHETSDHTDEGNEAENKNGEVMAKDEIFTDKVDAQIVDSKANETEIVDSKIEETKVVDSKVDSQEFPGSQEAEVQKAEDEHEKNRESVEYLIVDEKVICDKSCEVIPAETIESSEDLELLIRLETSRSLSKIPDNESIRTSSESPPGATESWKDATINAIQSGDSNTILRTHQTNIIYSNNSLNLGEVIRHHPLFVKNTSKYWYKPTISREEAVNMLKDKAPGTFVVRDSNSFPGAFGLALKVVTPPPGVNPGDGTELVRHFLIEPSPKGVKLKGCNNEPVFGTLSALVYQHSITPLALPTKLLLPEYDPANTPEHISAAQQLLQQGAACNVTYVASLDTESLTGPEAARRCIDQVFELLKQKMIQPVPVHFKVSAQGITITDNTRQLFFRRHYPVQSITYAGLDSSDRRWDNSYLEGSMVKYVRNARMFAFVARKIGSRTDNACHMFAELEPEQPATAVVNFITKVMMGGR